MIIFIRLGEGFIQFGYGASAWQANIYDIPRTVKGQYVTTSPFSTHNISTYLKVKKEC